MPRRERIVGYVRVPTDASTLNCIVRAGGLTARDSDKPDHFFLVNSGRNLASEVGGYLLEAASHELDKAVDRGTIKAWSLVL